MLYTYEAPRNNNPVRDMPIASTQPASLLLQLLLLHLQHQLVHLLFHVKRSWQQVPGLALERKPAHLHVRQACGTTKRG